MLATAVVTLVAAGSAHAADTYGTAAHDSLVGTAAGDFHLREERLRLGLRTSRLGRDLRPGRRRHVFGEDGGDWLTGGHGRDACTAARVSTTSPAVGDGTSFAERPAAMGSSAGRTRTSSTST
jgi:hypothetical protein